MSRSWMMYPNDLYSVVRKRRRWRSWRKWMQRSTRSSRPRESRTPPPAPATTSPCTTRTRPSAVQSRFHFLHSIQSWTSISRLQLSELFSISNRCFSVQFFAFLFWLKNKQPSLRRYRFFLPFTFHSKLVHVHVNSILSFTFILRRALFYL